MKRGLEYGMRLYISGGGSVRGCEWGDLIVMVCRGTMVIIEGVARGAQVSPWLLSWVCKGTNVDSFGGGS